LRAIIAFESSQNERVAASPIQETAAAVRIAEIFTAVPECRCKT